MFDDYFKVYKMSHIRSFQSIRLGSLGSNCYLTFGLDFYKRKEIKVSFIVSSNMKKIVET